LGNFTYYYWGKEFFGDGKLPTGVMTPDSIYRNHIATVFDAPETMEIAVYITFNQRACTTIYWG